MDLNNLGRSAADSSELSREILLEREVRFFSGVTFDAGNLTLNAEYPDELSAHRAKRVWRATLEQHFLLDVGIDFKLRVATVSESDRHILKCEFVSACARYALWRLTNNQAPEAQYIIETAHVPSCTSTFEDLITAPDLRPEPSILTGLSGERFSHRAEEFEGANSIAVIVKRLLARIKA